MNRNTIIVLLLGTFTTINAFQSNRIVGGTKTRIEEHPYQVSIHLESTDPWVGISSGHQCGGVIISEKHVLTAGHCYVDGADVGDYSIYAGFTNQSQLDPEHHYKVQSIDVHPKFLAITEGMFYDVAVITIQAKFKFGIKVRSIDLPVAGFYPAANTDAVVTGWGMKWTEGQLSNTLRMLKLKVANYQECCEIYRKDSQIVGPEMVCAGGIKNRDSCVYDSGGPLVADGKLIGLVSYGMADCGLDGVPGVYTNIGSVRDFIRNETNI